MQTTETRTRSTVASRIAALISHPKMSALRTDAQISARLLGLGIADVCSRCLGSGNYGPLCVEGGRCFGCSGKGQRAPKLTKVIEELAREAVAAGKLEAYVERRLAVAAAKKLLAGAVERMHAAYAASEWYRFHYEGKRHGDTSHVNALAYALPRMLEETEQKACSAVWAAQRGDADPAEAMELVESALADCARMDRAHEVARARYAECRAEQDEIELVAYPRRFDLERAHRVKWCAIAAEIWAAV